MYPVEEKGCFNGVFLFCSVFYFKTNFFLVCLTDFNISYKNKTTKITFLKSGNFLFIITSMGKSKVTSMMNKSLK